MRFVFILLLLLSFTSVLYGQEETTENCPQLPARLAVGEWARVTYNNAVNLRPEPSTQKARVDVIGGGTLIEIIDGPICAEGLRWWGIENGWIAEGSDALTESGEPDYWLEPRGLIQVIEDEDGVERAYVVDATGDKIERADCMLPPDDYTQVEYGGETFNIRTVVMLEHANRLFLASGGTIQIEYKVVQGSYSAGVDASFGTHDGGGAVDLSVLNPEDWSVMTEEVPLLIDALRTAGFAAWLRRYDELYPGSAIHIHAVAVGDEEQSEAARGQIDGTFGYLRGYNGLPQEEGDDPLPDLDGEPVICQWMIEMGYEDMR